MYARSLAIEFIGLEVNRQRRHSAVTFLIIIIVINNISYSSSGISMHGNSFPNEAKVFF